MSRGNKQGSLDKVRGEGLRGVDRPERGLDGNSRQTVRSNGQYDLMRAAHLFERIIELVEPQEIPGSTVPVEALSSLLRQCEELLEVDIDLSLPLFFGLPGMPMLNPDWWQGAAGWDVVKFPDSGWKNCKIPQPEQVQAMRGAREQIGQQLLAVMSTDSAPADLPDGLRPLALLYCHPWQSFLAAENNFESLEVFSAKILEFLKKYPNLPLHRIKLINSSDRLSCQKELLHLTEISPDDMAPDDVENVVSNGYLGGAPSYEILCERLGYDPKRTPGLSVLEAKDISRCAEIVATASSAENTPKALVSWFIDRVAALPSGEGLEARMRALVPSLDVCLESAAFPEAFDKATGQLRPCDAALLRLMAAAHFYQSEDALQSMGLIAEALEAAPADMTVLQQAGALLYLELKRPVQALEALAAPIKASGVLGDQASNDLETAIFKGAPTDAGQHGQALLLAALSKEPPLPAPGGRQRIMIEIGTTRETVPGQGSTRQLAMLCADLGIDFVTVDMDPANTRRAARMFNRLGLPSCAVTAKGEDYLADFDGMIDYVFLDAYDFDHGKHSELRQARYEQFLGDRINDAACHQMHLECAEALIAKLSPDGLICFDDTWLDENGDWTAKGKTAMPFLLESGFVVVEARNHAGLLRRKT